MGVALALVVAAVALVQARQFALLKHTVTYQDDYVVLSLYQVEAEYLAGKIYRFLVRDDLSAALRTQLGAVLRQHDYQVKPLLTAMAPSSLRPIRRTAQGLVRVPMMSTPLAMPCRHSSVSGRSTVPRRPVLDGYR